MPSKTNALFQGSALAFITLALVFLTAAIKGGGAAPLNGPVVVIASPWSDPSAAIEAAGGRLVAPTRAAFGLLATSDNPGFAVRLSELGYWSFRSEHFARLLCGVTR